MQDVIIGSSCCKAHQHSVGAKKNPNTQSSEHICMSQGGRNTKIHAVVDGLRNPLYIQLTGGHVNDITVAYELLKQVPIKVEYN